MVWFVNEGTLPLRLAREYYLSRQAYDRPIFGIAIFFLNPSSQITAPKFYALN
jgi:hypothetical protein